MEVQDQGAPGGAGAQDRKLVFLHLPKTGGTSLHHHLTRAFPPEQVCPERHVRLWRWAPEDLARYSLFSGHFTFDGVARIPGRKFIVTVLRAPKDRILSTYYFWKRHTDEEIERHDLKGPRLARQGDLLAFLRHEDPSVRDAIDNQIARYLAGHVSVWRDGVYRHLVDGAAVADLTGLEVVQRALTNLLSVDLIGFVETIDEVYARIAREFHLPPVERLERMNTRQEERPGLEQTREEEITPEITRELNRLTQFDAMVVNLARHHVRQRAARAAAAARRAAAAAPQTPAPAAA